MNHIYFIPLSKCAKIVEMKILLISDTHGKNKIVDELYRIYPNMDYYLHAGDSCTEGYALYPFESVRGNCDYDYNLNEQLLISTPMGNLLMKHVPNMLESDLKKLNIKFFVFGHLHERHFELKNDIYYISPGSTSYEKDKYKEGYVILEITDNDVKCEFFDL